MSDKHLKKKSKAEGAKMIDLQYFETGCKENYILRKTTLKFIILIIGIFGKKFILKHYAKKYSRNTFDCSTRF